MLYFQVSLLKVKLFYKLLALLCRSINNIVIALFARIIYLQIIAIYQAHIHAVASFQRNAWDFDKDCVLPSCFIVWIGRLIQHYEVIPMDAVYVASVHEKDCVLAIAYVLHIVLYLVFPEAVECLSFRKKKILCRVQWVFKNDLSC